MSEGRKPTEILAASADATAVCCAGPCQAVTTSRRWSNDPCAFGASWEVGGKLLCARHALQSLPITDTAILTARDHNHGPGKPYGELDHYTGHCYHCEAAVRAARPSIEAETAEQIATWLEGGNMRSIGSDVAPLIRTVFVTKRTEPEGNTR